LLSGVLQNADWAYYSSRKSASRLSPPAAAWGASTGQGAGKKEIGKRISEKNPPWGAVGSVGRTQDKTHPLPDFFLSQVGPICILQNSTSLVALEINRSRGKNHTPFSTSPP
jgi:hypothetical protein